MYRPSGEIAKLRSVSWITSERAGGGTSSKRDGGASVPDAGLITAHITPATKAPPTSATAIDATRREDVATVAPVVEASSDVPLISSSIWMRASPIACSRCFGAFFKHRARSGRTADAALGSH